MQALEEERLGARRQPYSDERNRRLAVQEAATALVCTLLPAIEPVTLVRAPLGALRVAEPAAKTLSAGGNEGALSGCHIAVDVLEIQKGRVLVGRAEDVFRTCC